MSDDALLPAARVVAYALSKYMDKETLRDARPGPDRLCVDTGLSLATVKRMLKALIARGWVEQTLQGGAAPGGPRRASVYAGKTRVNLRGVNLTGVTDDPVPVSEGAVTRVTSDTPSSNEPSKELEGPQPFDGWDEGLQLLRTTHPHLFRKSQ